MKRLVALLAVVDRLTVLMTGASKKEKYPVAWVRTYKKEKSGPRFTRHWAAPFMWECLTFKLQSTSLLQRMCFREDWTEGVHGEAEVK
jgi:hypothetical protein